MYVENLFLPPCSLTLGHYFWRPSDRCHVRPVLPHQAAGKAPTPNSLLVSLLLKHSVHPGMGPMAALVGSCCLSPLNHQPVCYDLWGNGPAACSSYLVLSYYRDRGKSTLCSKWVITHPTDIEDHGIHSHLLMANRWGKCGNSVRFHLLGFQNQCRQWPQPQN